jgi:uncharacterized protein (TIGR02757 family)
MIAALLAYGRVDLVCRTVGWVLDRMGPSPHAFLLAGAHRRPRWGAGFRYRFNSRRDLLGLFDAMSAALRRSGSLGASLGEHRARSKDLEGALVTWVSQLRADAAASATAVSPRSRGLLFLLPDPARGGPCKRWRLYLRWMVRPQDGTDVGAWSGIFARSELVLPLDTHWIRIGRRLGLTRRRTPDGKMAREITEALRQVHPEDPLRYDYPVCHLGISGFCPPRLKPDSCSRCPLRRICPTAAVRPRAAGPVAAP